MSGPEEERSNEVGWRQWHQLGSSALCCERDQRVWGMSLVAGGSFDVRGKSLRVVKSGISCLSPSVVLVVEGMKPVPWMRCSLGATCLCNLESLLPFCSAWPPFCCQTLQMLSLLRALAFLFLHLETSFSLCPQLAPFPSGLRSNIFP